MKPRGRDDSPEKKASPFLLFSKGSGHCPPASQRLKGIGKNELFHLTKETEATGGFYWTALGPNKTKTVRGGAVHVKGSRRSRLRSEEDMKCTRSSEMRGGMNFGSREHF